MILHEIYYYCYYWQEAGGVIPISGHKGRCMSIKRAMFICVLIVAIAYYCIQKASLEPSTVYVHAVFGERHKPIILWDIHNVIIKRDWSTFVRTLRDFPNKMDILRHSSLAMGKDMAHGLYDLIKSGSTGEVFVNVALKHHNSVLADLIIALANAQYIVPETAAIIYALHQRGYTQHIGSNIGLNMFKALINKPDMQSLFNTNIFDIEASQFGYYELDGLTHTIAKPNAVFYQTYLAKNNINPTEIVFIDDKDENVRAARETGLYALRFDNAKQLGKELWRLIEGEGPTPNQE